jgi:hypothetical protein
LDLYNGPVGTNQIHDFNPHIAPNGVFWTIFVPPDSVDVHFGAGQASFQLTTTVFDDHDLKSSLTGNFPPGFPQNAEVTFDVEWGGVIDTAHVRNDALNFEGDFVQTGSTIQWWAVEPSTGFQFTSEPPNPARLVNAVIGHEQNGVFF